MADTLVTTDNSVQHFSIPDGQLYIDGKWCDSQDGQSKSNTNPATEEIINQCAQATTEDADRAIRAARRAFDDGSWSKLDSSKRARFLLGMTLSDS